MARLLSQHWREIGRKVSEFKADLVYIVSSEPGSITQRDLSKNKKEGIKNQTRVCEKKLVFQKKNRFV